MTLKERIMNDLKIAMKAARSEEVGLLRLMIAAFKNREIANRGATGTDSELSDKDCEQVLRSEIKKRRDSIIAFKQGNREDLVKKEEAETVLIERYLPQQLSREEVRKIIEKSLAGKQSLNFGEAMKLAMKELGGGRADGSLVSAVVRDFLGAK